MAQTYGLIGSRADIGGLLADAQLRALAPKSSSSATWGVGFFEKDEVLLRRGSARKSGSGLSAQVKRLSCHGLLAHECDPRPTAPSPDSTPPLRYGHVLFTCHGVASAVDSIVEGARISLPEFLHRTVRGETLSEIAFALFLAEMPSSMLERTRSREPRRSADPLQASSLRKALRCALEKLDALCDEHGRQRFSGDLWVHTGEAMIIAHREGNLALQVLRGAEDMLRWGIPQGAVTGFEHSRFVTMVAQTEEIGHDWERLPQNLLFTARRGEVPESEAL